MKILVIHQPFPMGNYKLNQFIADHLSGSGHEVYTIQQLNGADYTEEYMEQIIDLKPDVCYYEMLDAKTFEIVEKLNCKKILIFVSKGILDKHEDILNYKDKWFTHIFTNSKIIYDLLSDHVDNIFKYDYYFTCLNEKKCIKDIKYQHDCTFLGQGYHRLTLPEFYREREVFFNGKNPFNFKIYGTGWPTVDFYGGILPADDIEKLYTSAKCGVSVIEADQHPYGMINNRYTEMAFCELPIITFDYKDVDWCGAEKYLNFIETFEDFVDVIKKVKKGDSTIVWKAEQLKFFMKTQHEIYLKQLKEFVND